jgi:hypothetical protein
MQYKQSKSQTVSVHVPAVTGANATSTSSATAASLAFYAWLPSTWPLPPAKFDLTVAATLRHIFDESILGEIENVIEDIKNSNGDLQHRGHVVAISLLCALDAISSYGYGPKSGKQIPYFIRAHFPVEYHRHAKNILYLYRHAMVHSWNLFAAAILPGLQPPTSVRGTLSFGLLNFFQALKDGTDDFLEKLESDARLQENTLKRYQGLRRNAKA